MFPRSGGLGLIKLVESPLYDLGLAYTLQSGGPIRFMITKHQKLRSSLATEADHPRDHG